MESVADMNMFLKIYDSMKLGFGGNPDFSLNNLIITFKISRHIYSFLAKNMEDFKGYRYDYF